MTATIGLENVQRDPKSVVTVGTFDGVHLGHQAIIKYLVDRARTQDGKSVVVTFDPHPREVVHGQPVSLLTTIEERIELLDALDLDHMVIIPFTTEFARLSSEDFVRDVLWSLIGLKEVVVGHDHQFGKGREGNSRTLEKIGAELGFTVDIIPAQEVEHIVVSSTEVRRSLQEGDVDSAAHMLGRLYRLTGTVVEGDRRGRLLGFPTANLQITNDRKVIPGHGVYAVKVTTGTANGLYEAGMMNIGTRPTFGSDAAPSLEVHLLDFQGDLYGAELRVDFVARLRDERKFDSMESLQKQLELDQENCKKVLGLVS